MPVEGRLDAFAKHPRRAAAARPRPVTVTATGKRGILGFPTAAWLAMGLPLSGRRVTSIFAAPQLSRSARREISACRRQVDLRVVDPEPDAFRVADLDALGVDVERDGRPSPLIETLNPGVLARLPSARGPSETREVCSNP